MDFECLAVRVIIFQVVFNCFIDFSFFMTLSGPLSNHFKDWEGKDTDLYLVSVSRTLLNGLTRRFIFSSVNISALNDKLHYLHRYIWMDQQWSSTQQFILILFFYCFLSHPSKEDQIAAFAWVPGGIMTLTATSYQHQGGSSSNLSPPQLSELLTLFPSSDQTSSPWRKLILLPLCYLVLLVTTQR